MKALVLLLCCLPAVAQSPEAIKYAPRQVLLVDPTPGTESVLPMVFTIDGKQQIQFVPVHDVKESLGKGGRPVTLADILTALGAATEKVSQLQAENDKLWKVAMKDAPRPETVVVQLPAGPPQVEREQADADARRQQAIQMWVALQNANRTQNVNVNVTNCTRLPALCVGR